MCGGGGVEWSEEAEVRRPPQPNNVDSAIVKKDTS